MELAMNITSYTLRGFRSSWRTNEIVDLSNRVIESYNSRKIKLENVLSYLITGRELVEYYHSSVTTDSINHLLSLKNTNYCLILKGIYIYFHC